MTRRSHVHVPRRAVPAVVLALLCLGDPAAAQAAAPSCPSRVAVETDPALQGRWPSLPDQIGDAFARRSDVDRCARVELTLDAEGRLRLAVALPDGRTAERTVSRAEDVLPTLEALLLVPEDERPAPMDDVETDQPATVAEPEPRPPAPLPAATVLAPLVAPRAPTADRGATDGRPTSESGRLRIELSLAPSARIGDGQAGASLGICSLVDVGGWLAGFSGRADTYQAIGSGELQGAVQLALLGGHRFRLDTSSLDVTAGAAVAYGGGYVEQAGPAEVPVSEPAGNVPRLVAGTRLNFGARSILRTFVGLDGEVGPSSTDGMNPPGRVQELPTWTVGASVGATVGTL